MSLNELRSLVLPRDLVKESHDFLTGAELDASGDHGNRCSDRRVQRCSFIRSSFTVGSG